jgi:hypothetical protein
MVMTVEDMGVSQMDFLRSLHNDVVGHHGVKRMLGMLQEIEFKGEAVRRDVERIVSECPVCQKVKYQKPPVVVREVRTIQGSYPMKSVAVDAMGPVTKDEDGNQYILVIVDEFSKFASLVACKSVEAGEYVRALLQHISLFGVMERVRTDGATQFTAKVCGDLSRFLGVQHFVILPYHPQANGIVERRNAEIMKHLRVLVMERRIRNIWSRYLAIVQNVINNTVDSSIGIAPARLIFGNGLKTNLEWVIKRDKEVPQQPVSEYVQELERTLTVLNAVSKDYVDRKVQEKKDKVREIGGRVSEIKVGEYVLVTYPTRPPSKLSPIYRGPFIVVEKVRDDIYKCRDITSNKVLEFHVDRLRIFKCSPDVQPEELLELAAVDKEEFVVEEIVDHRGTGKSGDPLEFRIRWAGWGPEDDTWEPYRQVKELEALDRYEQRFPNVLRYQRGRK